MSAPDRPTPTGGPWTRHGHDIPGVTVAGGHPPAVARCGGPALCRKCREDVELAHGGTSAAPDRPTREQVDLALADADLGATMVGNTLAAEVRALRAEVDREVSIRDTLIRQVETEDSPCLCETCIAIRLDGLRAALVARTPQPAEPTRHPVILSRLAREIDQHAAVAARPGQMGDLERIASAVRDVAKELTPLPAVPNGQARRGPEQCCDLACNGGGCETCPCCSAGWCLTGRDGLPDEADVLAAWLETAAPHNALAAAWLAERTDRTPRPAEDSPVHAEACRIIREAWGALPESVAHLTREEGATLAGCIRAIPAPLPAVPDGEDARPLSDLDLRQIAAVPALLELCDDAETAAESELAATGTRTVPVIETEVVRMAVAGAVPGEDVPACLDAAADALAETSEWQYPVNEVRRLAGLLRNVSPTARAAVAAALARPTEPQG